MTPLRSGKIVADRFEIVRVADSGGMGVVYQALDRTAGGHVALKVLMHTDQGPSDRFASEVEFLSTLDHPHIVGYVSHGATEFGAPFLVMPWLDGIDLDERLRSGPLSIADTLVLAKRVAEALAYLHARGLVHRDLKPSNLFLPAGRVAEVQVIDLGVARTSIASRALTLSGVLIGTPGFIAPEQARGDRDVAPAVDIFAFGCVLFECLTGQRLFSGAHVMSVLAKILLEDAPRVRELCPDAPTSLDLLIHRMVAKDPDKRPRDGAELLAWLDDMDRAPPDDDEPVSIRALTASERRVVTVLVVILPGVRRSMRPPDDATRADSGPLGVAAARFGVRIQLLADETAIVLAPVGVAAADQAAILARFARHVADTFAGASIALTTGSAITGSPLPAGEALDRAVTLVRRASPETGVLVDEVTASLITARFDIRREGSRLVVETERSTLDPTRPLLGRPTSCVGRERELAILDASLSECADGDGPKIVLVTAAAGAGKSRLRHEFIRRHHADDPAPLVLQCQADPLHATTPYALLSQALRQALDLSTHDPPEQIRERVRAHVGARLAGEDAARVSSFLGELVGARFSEGDSLALRAARSDATAMADQIGRAFEDILQAWCRERVVVVVIEDLHWGDAASARLLDRALRKLMGRRLFILVLARPEVHERFPQLFANRDVTAIRLPPLAKRACEKLIRSIIDEGAPIDVARLVERSEGNAFFLEELIRAADDQVRRGGGPGSHDDDLPTTVIALAQARLERLEPHARKVLRAASIFGDVFPVEGVGALTGESSAAIAPVIAALVEHEAIMELEQPRRPGVRELAFRHTLLRSTAQATLINEDRTLGHRLAAKWLEGRDEDGEIVGLHWLEADDRTEAAASFARAGEARWLRAQADAAARCAMRSLLVSVPRDESLRTIAARIQLLANALGASRSLDARDAVSGMERHTYALDVKAQGTASALVRVAVDHSLEHLRNAPADPLLPLVLADAASALGALGDFTGANELLAEAGTLAADDYTSQRRIGYATARLAYWRNDAATATDILAETILPEDPRARFEMLLILAWAVVMTDGRPALARGLDFVSRAEAIVRPATEDGRPRTALDDPVAQLHCARARGGCFHFAGEYAKAAEAAEEGVALARRTGLRSHECAHLHNGGEQYLHLGESERARSLLLEARALSRDVGLERFERQHDVLLDYLDGASDRLIAQAALARASGDVWLELYARYWLARLLTSTRAAEARAALDQALVLARSLKVRVMIDDCARDLETLDAPGTGVTAPRGTP